jgi:hypothetical protein
MDSNEIERERGITIKLNTARMKYTAKNGQLYALNLIDTPGIVAGLGMLLAMLGQPRGCRQPLSSMPSLFTCGPRSCGLYV